MPDTSSAAAYPFGSPMPGANFGGSQQSVPSPASGTSPSIGGAANPFLPGIPNGLSQPGSNSYFTPGQGDQILNPWYTLGLGNGVPDAALGKGFESAGYGSGVANALVQFLKGGAGFNPDVANALIAALKPRADQSRANVMEQFSSMGLRDSSPAAYGTAQLEGQLQLDYGQIFAQMYEQAISNYMNVLTGARRNTQPTQTGVQQFQGISSGIGALLQGLGSTRNGGGQTQQPSTTINF